MSLPFYLAYFQMPTSSLVVGWLQSSGPQRRQLFEDASVAYQRPCEGLHVLLHGCVRTCQLTDQGRVGPGMREMLTTLGSLSVTAALLHAKWLLLHAR